MTRTMAQSDRNLAWIYTAAGEPSSVLRLQDLGKPVKNKESDIVVSYDVSNVERL